MFGKWKKKLIKIRKKLHKTYDSYLKYCREPVDETLILLEAGQGKNMNGNMFAVLRELCTNSRWSGLRVVFVVTNGSMESTQQRFAFYGYQPELVVRNSEEYCHRLATAKYLLTDNSFPPYFHKREGQIYMNTWHGTPLKTLGKSEIQNVKSMANLQKNYLMSDYALFPNEFTRDVFMKDYMLENIYRGKVVLCDYPRNGILLDEDRALELRKKLGLEEKQLIAYMPTWRGSNRRAQIRAQKKILQAYFEEIDGKLRDDQIFYVNLHFLVGNEMNFDEFAHIRPFPCEYETYDFLAVCDMLVTDYSSVFFDFAPSRKKVILFAYDLEEYMENRGTYFPIESLPFPLTFQVDELVEEINSGKPVQGLEAFLEKYCAYCDLNTSEKVLALMTEGTCDAVKVENAPDNGKELLLLYGGKLTNKFLNRFLLEYMGELDREKYNLILGVSGNFFPQTIETLQSLPEHVSFLNLVSEYNFPVVQRILSAFALRSSFLSAVLDRYLQPYYEAEKERLFYGLQPAKVINFSGNPTYLYKILSCFSCEKEAHVHHWNMMGFITESRLHRVMLGKLPDLYDTVSDHRGEDVYRFWEDEEKEGYYNKCCQVGNVFLSFKNGKDAMEMRSLARVRTMLPCPLSELRMQVHDKQYQPQMRKGIRWGRKYRLTTYKLKIPYEDMAEFEINNKVNVVYHDSKGAGLRIGIRYRAKNRDKRKWAKGPIQFLTESNTSAYFRQSVRNWTYFTVRTSNLSDTRKEQMKMNAAYYLAKILPDKNRILLFEKNSARYEESASVLYEKLTDQGYRNVYFILDKSYPFYDAIPEKYRGHLIGKGTLKHYLYFFQGKNFIGTETIAHAIDLRVDNKYAREKLAAKNINYVFLQHGVMYMVSLDSESRTFFKPNTTCGKYRVVTSSQEEARHFTELGQYDPELLYICGLPKYDRNYMNETADKIVIMPTWRPWEYNGVRFDFSQTKYYQMICRIFSAVPDALKDKVVILPHPLFYDAVKNSEFDLKKYMDCESKYDDILKETRVLITDYSSIAYDAFYRGSNVIFYWEEKEECLQNYGQSTKLMLQEDNIFGDICYDREELENILPRNYSQSQREEYVKNYRNIVAFHDGKNTERLIELLKEDEIL